MEKKNFFLRFNELINIFEFEKSVKAIKNEVFSCTIFFLVYLACESESRDFLFSKKITFRIRK